MLVTTAYKVERRTGSSSEWKGNKLLFETEAGAEAYAKDDLARLADRWGLAREWRVVETWAKPFQEVRP